MEFVKIPTKHDVSAIMRNAWQLHRSQGGEPPAFSMALERAWSDARRSIQAMIPLAVREERTCKLRADIAALSGLRSADATAARIRLQRQIASLTF